MDVKNIKTYSGIDPYAFISYSHKDSVKVIPVIEDLCKSLYRIWYDAGIEIGSNWPEAVATHLLCSNMVVFFISKDFLASQNCQREVNYAVAEKKKSICIMLDDTKLSTGMSMQLSVSATIDGKDGDYARIAKELKENLGDEFIGDGITGYTAVTDKKKSINIWRIISIVLVFALILGSLGIYGYYNNWFDNAGISKETVTSAEGEEIEINSFKDSVSMSILLKSYSGESLYLCGNTMVSDGNAIVYKDGKWLINGEAIEKGSMDSCDVIADAKDLLYLSLTNESIEDFSGLENMTNLIYLDISGNPVKDLSFIKDMNNLQILKLIDTEVTDYSIISELKNLKYLYISEEQLSAVKENIDISETDIVVK